MAERPLTPDEALLWQRVMANVRPAPGGRTPVRTKARAAPAAIVALPRDPVRRRAPAKPEEPLSWHRVVNDVRPLAGRLPVAAPPRPQPAEPSRAVPAAPAAPPAPMLAPALAPTPKTRPNTLDGSWDKQLGRGAVSPDSTIDLHGHTLQSAYVVLDHGLARAIAHGDRVLLLVTGKPPRPESERPHARGAIRAAVADWLAGSRHADRIAAVRGAHPRHGGAGALYIILRRSRTSAN
jgi:DNA-nicking Smr family endonuclease